MPTLDRPTLAALRLQLASARAAPDSVRLDQLGATLEKLLDALEGYSASLRTAGAASASAAVVGVTVDVQGDVSVRAASTLTLGTGAASITLKSNGDVTIRGKDIDMKATKDVAIRGSKIADETTPSYKGRPIEVGRGKIRGN